MTQEQLKVLKHRLTSEMFLDITGNKEKVFDKIMQESGVVDPPDPAQGVLPELGSKEAAFTFGLKVEPPSDQEKKILEDEAAEAKALTEELKKAADAAKAKEEAEAKAAAEHPDDVPPGQAKPPVDPFATPAQVY